MTHLEAALELALEGAWVFPCSSTGEKRPGGVYHGHLDATTSPTLIHQWWGHDDPEAGIGIYLRASGRIALDIDAPEGFETLYRLEADLGPLPETLTVRSGGDGEHRNFRAPDEQVHGYLGTGSGRVVAALGQGLHVKYNGYVVAPPSLHKSGRRYEWLKRIPCAELPTAWMAHIIRPERPPAPAPRTPTETGDVLERARKYLAAMEPAISGQGGHEATFRAAIALARGFALDEEDTYSLLANDYNPRCQPAWSERELRHKARSAAGSTTVPLGYLLEREPPRPNRQRSTGPVDGDPPPLDDADAPADLGAEEPSSEPAAEPAPEPEQKLESAKNNGKPAAKQPPFDPEAYRIGRRWPDVIELLDRRAAGQQSAVPTSLPGLDRMLDGGLPLGQVALWIGSPGLGKTAGALELAVHHVERGNGVAVFWSLELPYTLILSRLVCQRTCAPWSKVLRGACPNDVAQTYRETRDLPLYIVEDRNPEVVGELVRAVAQPGRATLLVVDYLQLLASGARDLRQGVEDWSGKLVEFAKITGAAILAISSTSRNNYAAGEDGKIDLDKVLAMARDSGRLEYDAAALLALLHVRKKGDDEAPGRYRKCWLVLAKSRLGPTGKVPVEVDAQAGVIREIKPEDMTPAGESLTDEQLRSEILRLVSTQQLTGQKAVCDRVQARHVRTKHMLSVLLAEGVIDGGRGKPYFIHQNPPGPAGTPSGPPRDPLTDLNGAPPRGEPVAQNGGAGQLLREEPTGGESLLSPPVGGPRDPTESLDFFGVKNGPRDPLKSLGSGNFARDLPDPLQDSLTRRAEREQRTAEFWAARGGEHDHDD